MWLIQHHVVKTGRSIRLRNRIYWLIILFVITTVRFWWKPIVSAACFFLRIAAQYCFAAILASHLLREESCTLESCTNRFMALRTYRSKSKVTCIRTGKTKKVSRYKIDVSEPTASNFPKRQHGSGNDGPNPDGIGNTLDEQCLNIATNGLVPTLYCYYLNDAWQHLMLAHFVVQPTK